MAQALSTTSNLGSKHTEMLPQFDVNQRQRLTLFKILGGLLRSEAHHTIRLR